MMGLHQAKLEQRQALLGRVVDIGAELFAIASAVVYANTIKSEHPERAEGAFELADLFCQQARRRVDELFTALWQNDDVDNYDTAVKVLEGRYTWMEEGIADPSGSGEPAVAGQPEGLDEPRRPTAATGRTAAARRSPRRSSSDHVRAGPRGRRRSSYCDSAHRPDRRLAIGVALGYFAIAI
jgi:hypothetical protein